MFTSLKTTCLNAEPSCDAMKVMKETLSSACDQCDSPPISPTTLDFEVTFQLDAECTDTFLEDNTANLREAIDFLKMNYSSTNFLDVVINAVRCEGENSVFAFQLQFTEVIAETEQTDIALYLDRTLFTTGSIFDLPGISFTVVGQLGIQIEGNIVEVGSLSPCDLLLNFVDSCGIGTCTILSDTQAECTCPPGFGGVLCDMPEPTTISLELLLTLRWQEAYSDLSNTLTVELLDDFRASLEGFFAAQYDGFNDIIIIELSAVDDQVNIVFDAVYDVYIELNVATSVLIDMLSSMQENGIMIGGLSIDITGVPSVIVGDERLDIGDVCFLFDGLTLCGEWGTCFDNNGTANCQCEPPYSGEFCLIAPIEEEYGVTTGLPLEDSTGVYDDDVSGIPDDDVTGIPNVTDGVTGITDDYGTDVTDVTGLSDVTEADFGVTDATADYSDVTDFAVTEIPDVTIVSDIDVTDFAVTETPDVTMVSDIVCEGVSIKSSSCAVIGAATVIRDATIPTSSASREPTTCSTLDNAALCLEGGDDSDFSVLGQTFREFFDTCTESGIDAGKWTGCSEAYLNCVKPFDVYFRTSLTSEVNLTAACSDWEDVLTCLEEVDTEQCEGFDQAVFPAMTLVCSGQGFCEDVIPNTVLTYMVALDLEWSPEYADNTNELTIEILQELNTVLPTFFFGVTGFQGIEITRLVELDGYLAFYFDVIFDIYVDLRIQGQISIQFGQSIQYTEFNIFTDVYSIFGQIQLMFPEPDSGALIQLDIGLDQCFLLDVLNACGAWGRCQANGCICNEGFSGPFCQIQGPTVSTISITFDYEWDDIFLDLTDVMTQNVMVELRGQLESRYANLFDGFAGLDIFSFFNDNGRLGINFNLLFDFFLSADFQTQLGFFTNDFFGVGTGGGLNIGGLFCGALGFPEFGVTGPDGIPTTVPIAGACFLYDAQGNCGVNGLCADVDGSPVCSCNPGFSGEYCDIAEPVCNGPQPSEITCLVGAVATVARDMTSTAAGNREPTTCRGLLNAVTCVGDIGKAEYDDISVVLSGLSDNCNEEGLEATNYEGCNEDAKACVETLATYFNGTNEIDAETACSDWEAAWECLDGVDFDCQAINDVIKPGMELACKDACPEAPGVPVPLELSFGIDLEWDDAYLDLTSDLSVELQLQLQAAIRAIFGGEDGFLDVKILSFTNNLGQVNIIFNSLFDFELDATQQTAMALLFRAAIDNGINLGGTNYAIIGQLGLSLINSLGVEVTVPVTDACFQFNIQELCLNRGECTEDDDGLAVCSCPDGFLGVFCDEPEPTTIDMSFVLDLGWNAAYVDLVNTLTVALTGDVTAVLNGVYVDLFDGFNSLAITGFRDVMGNTEVSFSLDFNYYLEVDARSAISLALADFFSSGGTISIDGVGVDIIGVPNVVLPLPDGEAEIVAMDGPCYLFDFDGTCENGGICVINDDDEPECSCGSGFSGDFCTEQVESCNGIGIDVAESACLIKGVATVIRDFALDINGDRTATTCQSLEDSAGCLGYTVPYTAPPKTAKTAKTAKTPKTPKTAKTAKTPKSGEVILDPIVEAVDPIVESFLYLNEGCTDAGIWTGDFEGCAGWKDILLPFADYYISNQDIDPTQACSQWQEIYASMGDGDGCYAINDLVIPAMEKACKDICEEPSEGATGLDFSVTLDQSCSDEYLASAEFLALKMDFDAFVENTLGSTDGFRSVTIIESSCSEDGNLIVDYKVFFEITVAIELRSQIAVNLNLAFQQGVTLAGTLLNMIGNIEMMIDGGIYVPVVDACFLHVADSLCINGLCVSDDTNLPSCQCENSFVGQFCQFDAPSSTMYRAVLDMSWINAYLTLTSGAGLDLAVNIQNSFLALMGANFDGISDITVVTFGDSQGQVKVEFIIQYSVSMDVLRITQMSLSMIENLELDGGLMISGTLVGFSTLPYVVLTTEEGGEDIEVVIDQPCFLYDAQEVCLNDGVCDVASNITYCLCPPEYNGEFCELFTETVDCALPSDVDSSCLIKGAASAMFDLRRADDEDMEATSCRGLTNAGSCLGNIPTDFGDVVGLASSFQVVSSYCTPADGMGTDYTDGCTDDQIACMTDFADVHFNTRDELADKGLACSDWAGVKTCLEQYEEPSCGAFTTMIMPAMDIACAVCDIPAPALGNETTPVSETATESIQTTATPEITAVQTTTAAVETTASQTTAAVELTTPEATPEAATTTATPEAATTTTTTTTEVTTIEATTTTEAPPFEYPPRPTPGVQIQDTLTLEFSLTYSWDVIFLDVNVPNTAILRYEIEQALAGAAFQGISIALLEVNGFMEFEGNLKVQAILSFDYVLLTFDRTMISHQAQLYLQTNGLSLETIGLLPQYGTEVNILVDGNLVLVTPTSKCYLYDALSYCVQGSCIDSDNGPLCSCQDGWEGLQCDIETPEPPTAQALTTMRFRFSFGLNFHAFYSDLTNVQTQAFAATIRYRVRGFFKKFTSFQAIRIINFFEGSVGTTVEADFGSELNDPEMAEAGVALSDGTSQPIDIGGTDVPIEMDPIYQMPVGDNGGYVNVPIDGPCFLYNSDGKCRNEGQCIEDNNLPLCQCTEGYQGEFCDVSSSSADELSSEMLAIVIIVVIVIIIVVILVICICMAKIRRDNRDRKGSQMGASVISNRLRYRNDYGAGPFGSGMPGPMTSNAVMHGDPDPSFDVKPPSYIYAANDKPATILHPTLSLYSDWSRQHRV